jgi:hypothetical protein
VPGDGVPALGSVGDGVPPSPGDGVRPPGVRPPRVRPPGVPPPGEGVPPPGEGVPPPGEGVPPPGDGVLPPGEGVPPPGEGVPPPGDGELPPGDGVPPPGVGDPPGNGTKSEPGIRPGGKMVIRGSYGFNLRPPGEIGAIPIPGASVVMFGSTPGIVRLPGPGGLVPPGVNPTRLEPSKTPGARTLPPVTDAPVDRRGVALPATEPVITPGGAFGMMEDRGGSARAGTEFMTQTVTKQVVETLR